jgi:hypothetical protein
MWMLNQHRPEFLIGQHHAHRTSPTGVSVPKNAAAQPAAQAALKRVGPKHRHALGFLVDYAVRFMVAPTRQHGTAAPAMHPQPPGSQAANSSIGNQNRQCAFCSTPMQFIAMADRSASEFSPGTAGFPD